MELSTKEYRSLSNSESYLLLALAEKDKKIFSISDVKSIIPKRAKKITHNLMKKKWILPLKKGLYAIVPLDIGVKGADSFIVHEFIIASFLAEPYYIGFWSALNYHGMIDQIPRTTFVATTKAKKPVNAQSQEFYFVTLSSAKFFGYESIEISDKKVNISNINKTICDCLDHPQHSGGIEEVARSIYFSHKLLSFEKILEYAFEMENLTIIKRLGYIFEKTGLLDKYQKIFSRIKLSKGFSKFSILAPKKGHYNSKWRLLINKEIEPERWMY